MPDLQSFLQSWIANPRLVGAIAPSSRDLARLITSEIEAGQGPVLELGPGTGVFTRALLERGIPESDLVLVEYDGDFAHLLGERFPKARILAASAAELRRHRLFEDAPLGAVVSGLPLLNMPYHRILAIIAGAFSYMRPDAAFYQFTYGPRCPVPRRLLDRLGLRAAYLGRALRNLPPAAVYRISRRPVTLQSRIHPPHIAGDEII